MNLKLSTDRYYGFLTLCFLGFGIIIALVTSFVNYRTHFEDIEESLYEISVRESQIKSELLSNYIDKNEDILRSLLDNELTNTFLENSNKVNRYNIEQLFKGLTDSNIDLMQLRYIDEKGQEIIRVDRKRDDNQLFIIPVDELQDKSDRYYFKESVKLKESEIWYSNIDLNIENGVMEIPYNPTLRIAIPVYINGENRGFFISNLMFSNQLEDMVSSSTFDISIADVHGDVLYNSVEKNVWSKYLDSGESLYESLPEVADSIVVMDNFSTSGIYSFNIRTVLNNNEDIKFVFVAKSGAIDQLRRDNLLTALFIALTVFLISIPLSWLVSLLPSKLQSKLNAAYAEIQMQSKIINKNVMILTADKYGLVTDISSNFSKVTGYSKDELVGHSHSLSKLGSEVKEVKDGEMWEGELQEKTKDGKPLWMHFIITPKVTETGSLESLTAVCNNITDKKNIEIMSETDTLTGLYNRRKLEEIFSKEKGRSERYNENFSIILFDIDFFKKVNDVYGHLAGDCVLTNLSRIVKDNIRDLDYLCRWGGEEFLIISTNKNISEASKFAEKIRVLVEQFDFPEVGNVTISCGTTQFINGEDLKTTINRVDSALYEAKDSGRNRVVTK